MKLKIVFIISVFLTLLYSCNKKIEEPKVISLTENILINKPIQLLSNSVLRGNGFTITLESGANCPAIVIGDFTNEPGKVKNVTISNVTLIGNSASQKDEIWPGTQVRSNGVTVRNGENVNIDKVKVYDFRSGGIVLERGCRNVIVSNSTSKDNYFDGLAAYETEDSVFFNLDLSNNKHAGASFDLNFNKCFFIKNTLSMNGHQGIFMRSSKNNEMERVVISESGIHGVFLASSEIPMSDASYNLFKSFQFLNNKEAFRINDITCVGNTLVDPTFKNNMIDISGIKDHVILTK